MLVRPLLIESALEKGGGARGIAEVAMADAGDLADGEGVGRIFIEDFLVNVDGAFRVALGQSGNCVCVRVVLDFRAGIVEETADAVADGRDYQQREDEANGEPVEDGAREEKNDSRIIRILFVGLGFGIGVKDDPNVRERGEEKQPDGDAHRGESMVTGGLGAGNSGDEEKFDYERERTADGRGWTRIFGAEEMREWESYSQGVNNLLRECYGF